MFHPVRFLMLVAVCGWANADVRELRAANGGVRVEPIRVAGGSIESGRLVVTTPWFDYQASAAPRSSWAWTWDCFEADTPNPAFGGPAGGCNDLYPPDIRWYYGASYHNSYTSGDMIECVPGVACEGVFLAWYWTVSGPGTSEHCYIFVETFEDWGGCEAPNPGSGALGGVLYDFGELGANGASDTPLYYYAGIDLSGAPLRHRMPLDGTGGFQLRFGRDYDPESGDLVMPTGCQAMLWGTGDAENPHDGRVGTQSTAQFDDDYLTDGQFDLQNECYDGFICPCHCVLGPCVGFTARVGSECGCIGDVVADGTIDLSDLALLLSSFSLPTPSIPNPCADSDQSGEVDLADLAALLSRIGTTCP